MAVYRHIRQVVRTAGRPLRPHLRIGLNQAAELVFRQIQMRRRQRRIGFVALRHGKAAFHFLPEPRRFGVHIAQAHQQSIAADVVKQGSARLFKKQRQVILYPGTEMAVGHGFVYGGAGSIGGYFFAKTGAEDFLGVGIGGKLMRGQQADFRHRCQGALAVGIEGFDAVDFIVEHIQPKRRAAAAGENIQNTAAHGKFTGGHHMGNMAVARFNQIVFERIGIQRLPALEPKSAPQHKGGRHHPLHGGGHRHQQYIYLAVFELP